MIQNYRNGHKEGEMNPNDNDTRCMNIKICVKPLLSKSVCLFVYYLILN